jgi:hypothetical protein
MDVGEFMAFIEMGDLIEMPEFGLRCSVGELYLGTPLDPQSRADEPQA